MAGGERQAVGMPRPRVGPGRRRPRAHLRRHQAQRAERVGGRDLAPVGHRTHALDDRRLGCRRPARQPSRQAAGSAAKAAGRSSAVMRRSCEQRRQRAARSGARMKASPTRKAYTGRGMRCTSAGARMPDSVTSSRSVARAGTSASVVSSETLEGAQVAVVDAHQRRLQLQRVPVRAVVHFHQHVHAQWDAQASRSAICASSRQAAMSRMQSAPARARFHDLVPSIMKSLAQAPAGAGGARLAQVVGRPGKALVGEHATGRPRRARSWRRCRPARSARAARPCWDWPS